MNKVSGAQFLQSYRGRGSVYKCIVLGAQFASVQLAGAQFAKTKCQLANVQVYRARCRVYATTKMPLAVHVYSMFYSCLYEVEFVG